MEPLLGELQYQKYLRDWINTEFEFTHAATLTLTPAFRTSLAKAETVCRVFQHKLNKAVWGRNRSDNGLAELAFVPIVQGDATSHNLHLHFAIGGFPTRLTESELHDRFLRSAHHTLGVWHQTDFAPIVGAWSNYITRELRQRNDRTLLIQYMSKGLKPAAG